MSPEFPKITDFNVLGVGVSGLNLQTAAQAVLDAFRARRKGYVCVAGVHGPDLMLEICQATQQTGYRHFFYGGAPGVAEELQARMESRFPGLSVAGSYCPLFRPLNTPKHERFMAESLPKLETTLMFGVGAAFDFRTGRARRLRAGSNARASSGLSGCVVNRVASSDATFSITLSSFGESPDNFSSFESIRLNRMPLCRDLAPLISILP